MKYLVDESTGYVRGGYEQPLKFSVSGHFVVDVPTILGVDPTPAYSDLIAAKVAAIRNLHSSLPNYFNSEFLDGAGSDVDTDPSRSRNYTTGPWKRTSLLPTGSPSSIVASPVMSIGVSITKLYFQCSYFLLHQVPSTGARAAASDLLYNFDPELDDFVDSPTGVTPLLLNTGGSVLATLTPGSEQAFVSGPVDVRVAFTNLNADKRIWISDWILLYG